jgi:hypothetical protein
VNNGAERLTGLGQNGSLAHISGRDLTTRRCSQTGRADGGGGWPRLAALDGSAGHGAGAWPQVVTAVAAGACEPAFSRPC